jgi:hypothetical protein
MSAKNEKATQKPVKLAYNPPRIFELGSIERIQTGRDGNTRDEGGGYFYA